MTDWLQPLGPVRRPKKEPQPQRPRRGSVAFEVAVERFAEQYISRKTGRHFSATSRRNVTDNLLGSPLTSFRAERGISSVEQWTGGHAADYLQWLQKELRRDSATIKKVRGQLRSFGFFCDERFHTTDAAGGALPALEVSSESDFDRPTVSALTREEVDMVLNAAPTRRDRLAIAMLLYTGVKPSELLFLERGHIRFERAPAVVEIRGSTHEGAYTDKERVRDIPLTVGQTVLPKLLRTHLADPNRPAKATRLFLSKRSDKRGIWQPLTLEGLRAMLFDVGVSTGISCSASRFRHTFCTRCADAGIPLHELQRYLGHKHSAMIAHYYRRPISQSALEAAARVRF